MSDNKVVNITITGRIPSKKNCKMALQIKGRCMVVNSGAYTKWKREVIKQIDGVKPIFAVKSVGMQFFAPDLRKTDLTNKAETIMDLLVEHKIIPDDNWFEIRDIRLLFAGVSKDNPRVEIEIL